MSEVTTDDLLQQCRAAIGPPPRTFGWWERTSYLMAPRPDWCVARDLLCQFFEGQYQLLHEGVVVWGHMIQANSMLFKPGPQNHPGEVVYCLDTEATVERDDLAYIAYQIGRLKHTEPAEPGLRSIADYLTNERTRVFGHEVPVSISPLLDCAISTVFFNRRHLPNGVLNRSFFPILLSPDTPRLAMVLPSKYWPPFLVGMWQS